MPHQSVPKSGAAVPSDTNNEVAFFGSPVRCTSSCIWCPGAEFPSRKTSTAGSNPPSLPQVNDHALLGVRHHLHFNNFVLRGPFRGLAVLLHQLAHLFGAGRSSAAAAASASTGAAASLPCDSGGKSELGRGIFRARIAVRLRNRSSRTSS